MFSQGGGPMLTRMFFGIVAGSLVAFSLSAQDLPKTQFKVIGLNSPTVASIVDEVPFWRETLPKASNGAIGADITPLNQMGIDDKTIPRLLRLGGMDFAGSLSGNTAGWPEVTKSLYPMSLGWSINVMAVNLNTWNRLDRRVQNFLLEQVRTYENKMWGTLKKATAEADNCNTGKQPCTMGKLANITIVPVKPAEAETHKKLVESAVLAGWAKRCGAECAAEWNNTAGRTLGLKAPIPELQAPTN